MSSYKNASELIEELKDLPKHLRTNNVRRKDVDSMAEFNVYWSLQKISAFEIIPQYKVGKYKIDFLLRKPSHNIGIEIDGREWHSIENDSTRDEYILNNSPITDIVRFTGTDASFTPSLCTNFLYKHYKNLFSSSHYSNWRERANNYLKHKLRHEGIVEIEPLSKNLNRGYDVHLLNLDFLMPEAHQEYLRYNDGVERHQRKDISEFTDKRSTNVKVMSYE